MEEMSSAPTSVAASDRFMYLFLNLAKPLPFLVWRPDGMLQDVYDTLYMHFPNWVTNPKHV